LALDSFVRFLSSALQACTRLSRIHSVIAAKEITSGNLMVNVSYYINGMGWHLLPGSPFNVNLCSAYQCPIPAGPVALKTTMAIPLLTPTVSNSKISFSVFPLCSFYCSGQISR
jgi:hypothetical protein